jgi:hypothetical protein
MFTKLSRVAEWYLIALSIMLLCYVQGCSRAYCCAFIIYRKYIYQLINFLF